MRLKGWPELLDALPQASAALGRRLTLSVAGDGPDRAAMENAARQRNLPVEFLGWISAQRRNDLLREADLLTVPSVWPEPFGMVGIEAGCLGVPSVGFAVGGIPDWLSPGISGELAPGERPTASELSAAIVRALRDPGHWQSLRQGAWRAARHSPSSATWRCWNPSCTRPRLPINTALIRLIQ